MGDSARSYTSRQMIERLVGYDTISSDSNLALISFVEAYLSSHGVASRRTGDDIGHKANLFATLGPPVEGGVVLSGHTDVVPVKGQAWDSDPFRVVERNDKLYGRGTSDMKSFLAVALALVPRALSAGLKVPIHLALSYDEEVGCLGVRSLIDDIKQSLPRPRAVVIGEPTSMRLITAHKGISTFVTTVTGKEAHSSQTHRATSAIMAGARLVSFLEDLAEEKRRQGPHDERFEPPHTTISVGLFEGGTALNIVPRHARMEWEFRLLPGDDGKAILDRLEAYGEQELLPAMRAVSDEASIVTQARSQVPPLRPEDESPAEDLVRYLTGANQTGAVSFGTEGGLFQDVGYSTVICGPGSIDQAHQPNEFIELSQVAACEDFIGKLIDWAATEP